MIEYLIAYCIVAYVLNVLIKSVMVFLYVQKHGKKKVLSHMPDGWKIIWAIDILLSPFTTPVIIFNWVSIVVVIIYHKHKEGK